MHDHHCVFIDNCVGARNFRAFLNFLIVYPIHTIVTFICAFYNMTLPGRGGPHALVLSLGLMYFMCFTLIVLTQTCPQILLAVRNSNSEELDKRTATQRAYKEAKIPHEWEFDSGSVIENLRQRLGRNPLMWCVPIPNADPPVFVRNRKFVAMKIDTTKAKVRPQPRVVAGVA
jgi:hypothetical protein